MTTDILDYVAFRGEKLTLVWHEGEPFVAVRPICIQLGLDWKSQHSKLTDPDFGACVVLNTTHDASGRQQEMFCLHVMDVPMWLANIKPSRVKPELADAVRAYRAECKLVLFEHVKTRFLGERNAAMESLVLLKTEIIVRKPLFGKIVTFAQMGWSFERIWRGVKRPRSVVVEAIGHLMRLGIMTTVPEGTPFASPLAAQLDMFPAVAEG